MNPPRAWVCSACGTRACFIGEELCDYVPHASIAPCSCDWDDQPWSADMPLIVNPSCHIHGEVP